ncbi:NAD-dependent epimerase/dehydratase family protein [Gryllotalpicola ginsengisoli]|uniref:NAD-dependent epimerase/dehydratase family protein n=1 Tax=Gryllotalpicola ginsengisoli TaxID=444608 RepID=UPI0003B6FA55|nr:NAD-dependent epimerase/dehydratase family protein [Gryllotalpicola ginsengisoli]
MRIVVIGATGHVGGYLVPRLVNAGHEVVALSRGGTPRYRDDPAWQRVTSVQVDRAAEEAAGAFGSRVAELGADVVIDMICFTRESAAQLVDAIRGRVGLLVMCSTIWVHGTLTALPAEEDDDLAPWGEYGTGKLAIERMLAQESAAPGGLPALSLRPGHISGPGWPVINPAGNLDPAVWRKLARGERLVLPDFGLGLLHHVHADDVAQAFQLAAELSPDRRRELAGRSYHVTSERALTLRGFAAAVAGWFGQEPQLGFAPWDEFAASTTPEFAQTTLEHISRSHAVSIERARAELGYRPGHTSLEATREALAWLIEHGRVDAPPLP